MCAKYFLPVHLFEEIIFGKQIFFKLVDMVTFPTKTSIHREKIANMYLICKKFEKTMFMLLIVFKMVETTFSNLQEGFSLISPIIYIEFAHQISHIRHSKYVSTFGTKISVCLKKVGDEAVDRNKHI